MPLEHLLTGKDGRSPVIVLPVPCSHSECASGRGAPRSRPFFSPRVGMARCATCPIICTTKRSSDSLYATLRRRSRNIVESLSSSKKCTTLTRFCLPPSELLGPQIPHNSGRRRARRTNGQHGRRWLRRSRQIAALRQAEHRGQRAPLQIKRIRRQTGRELRAENAAP